jgi:hypothetical protein
MFERLGIAENVKLRIIFTQEAARGLANVAAPQAEVVLALFSEVLPVAGVELFGRSRQTFRAP